MKWALCDAKVVDRLCKQYMAATPLRDSGCRVTLFLPNITTPLEGLNGRHKEEATEWEKKPVAEYFKDHCEWFEDKAHQHWAFATKAEHNRRLRWHRIYWITRTRSRPLEV